MAKNDQVDLFDDVDGDDDDDNLLDEVVEDDTEAWVPSEAGDGIQGRVLKVGETRSDFSDDKVPTVTLETKDGSKVRVIGYGAVLRRELLDQDPKAGDKIAIKYFGERTLKKGKFAGKTYKHFGVAVKRS